ncbi:MAG: extracellular solute-binding protein [Clostridia bacterium]|nr:extracellular solute-binding protein [Clostridia bacterium]
MPEFEEMSSSGYDLGGYNILWGWTDGAGLDNDSNFGFIEGTPNSDLLLEHKKNVEQKLNCKITLDHTANNTILRAGVMAGDQKIDIITSGSLRMMDSIRGGYLTGLSSFIDVENYEKWGTPNMLVSVLWEDDLYAVVPFSWPEIMYTNSAHVLAINENLISKLSLTDPREYVEALDWTWDRFEECMENFTFEDAGRTVYSYKGGFGRYYYINMVISNGVSFIDGKNGTVSCGILSDAGREAMERGRYIAEMYRDKANGGSDNPTGFINGEAVMYLAWTYELTRNTQYIMYQMDNVGVVPFPQGPNATPGQYSSYHQSLAYATGIPFNAKDFYTSLTVLNEMFEPFEQYKTKDDIIDMMANQIFFDRRDAELIYQVEKASQYGFFDEKLGNILEQAGTTNTPISQLCEEQESTIAKIVETYLEPCYRGLTAVYGEQK